MRGALQVLSITLALLGAACAQTPAAQPPQETDAQTPQTPAGQLPQETEVTGTVVSVDDQLLVIRTDDGQLQVGMTTATERPEQPLQIGDGVRVWHRPDETTGGMVAVRIERQDTVTAQVEPAEDPIPEAAPEAQPAEPLSEVAPEAGQELPATASSTPLLALLGALAVGGAVALRLAARML